MRIPSLTNTSFGSAKRELDSRVSPTIRMSVFLTIIRTMPYWYGFVNLFIYLVYFVTLLLLVILTLL